MIRAYVFVLVILALLQVGDGYTTTVALTSGQAQEASPWLAHLMRQWGVVPVLAVGKAFAIALIILLYRDRQMGLKHPSLFAAVAACTIFYSFVVASNAQFLIA